MISEQIRGFDRRLLVAGAGLAGVVLGLVLLVTVFGGDGGTAAPAPSLRPTAAPAVEVKVPQEPTPVELALVLPVRDPFRQLVGVPKAQPSGPAQPSSQPPSQAPPVAAPSVAAPSGAAPPTTRPADANTKASLELKSIVKDSAGVARANITVDGKPYSPAQGDVFSYGYRLERIEGNCVEVSAQGGGARMCAPSKR